MFAKVILTTMWLVAAASSVAVGVPLSEKVAVDEAFSVVGFTDKFSDGGQGKVAMDALCQEDFSPGARMCEGWEFFIVANPPRPTVSDSAWINDTDQVCGNWTDTIAKTDYLVTATRRPPYQTSCLTRRPVTCCVPPP